MKSIFLIIIAAFSSNLLAQIPTNGLIAYFPFFGNARDSSNSKTHGTITGATLTSDRFGNPNAAYSFTGSTYISFSGSNVQNNRYTYSIWAKINTLPASGNMAFALNIGSSGGDQSLNIANNYSTYNGWLGGGYNTIAPNFGLQQNSSLSTTGWTHVVAVRDSNNVVLYINGVRVDSLGSNGVKYPSYGGSLVKGYIGIRNDKSAGFKGNIDDVCIYDRALSKSEVMQLFNDQSTSIQDFTTSSKKMNVFPNPNSNTFNLELINQIPATEINIKIYNSVGQEISDFESVKSELTIQVNHNFDLGIYYMYVYDKSYKLIAIKKIAVI